MLTVEPTITQLFTATDARNWEEVAQSFAPKVQLDYSSMNGQPASILSPQEIMSAWQGLLPGFDHTHHQLGNFLVTENGDQAQATCYGTASHYLENEGENLWTVVGTYDFDLVKLEGAWKISSMVFHYIRHPPEEGS